MQRQRPSPPPNSNQISAMDALSLASSSFSSSHPQGPYSQVMSATNNQTNYGHPVMLPHPLVEHYQHQQQQQPHPHPPPPPPSIQNQYSTPPNDNRKIYACQQPGCNKYFNQPSSLRLHARTNHGSEKLPTTSARSQNGGGRPYICQYAGCGKSFTQFGNLKTHSRKHTGERPYQCSYEGCEKAFTQLGNLKTHEKIHWAVKPYLCHFPGCGKGFTQRGNLKTHQIKVHQYEP
ncbi:uncharacterized protein BYT42DRAFT_569675 [Radiomyces spectabilis]|uniref:uncharacterized protein n=1 Tax=Radiomyces spectabilis TaxID=64574 RepID=UPI00221F93F6|nr:uncharacterized protein BYT42DRAFT_569675 [Radiomyces spectabilis]KAI8379693.1 hypothetical protein BYT42DRAFT_569675 [Radiomyces spectabilis]